MKKALAGIKKQENLIMTMVFLAVLLLFTALRYDYYYDLNDDVLMKDILAGVYTGMPEDRNIQMHWLISLLISSLYRLIRGIPWYGLFLCSCHYGCIGCMVCRSLKFCQNRKEKLLLLLAEGIMVTALFLDHLVSAQYTVTTTLLCTCAAFLFLTTDMRLPAGEFIKQNIGTMLLVSVAYLLRSEMTLLVFPLIGAAGVIKWGSEDAIFCKRNFIKYFSVIGGILAGVILGEATHALAYGSTDWKAFTRFFDHRTELYDFQEIPEYDEHALFYEEIGLSESEKLLFDNYNFGLDSEINDELIGKVAAYAKDVRKARMPLTERLITAFKAYCRRTLYGPSHNESDYPYSTTVILLYLAILLSVFWQRGRKMAEILWKLGLLLAVRTVLWLWLIERNRVPVRISHSMYIMEAGILLGILLLQQGKEKYRCGCCLVFLLAGIVFLPSAVKITDADVRIKAENNRPYQELYAYLRDGERPENAYYLIDVYSSVRYTEKMFENVDNTLANYDICGGWFCKSPLWKKKMAVFGITDVEKDLLEKENVFFVQEEGESTDWLTAYYRDHGKEVEPKPEERIAGFCIYQIAEKR